MTIDDIFNLVQVFSNKEQRGSVTPGDFNLLAKKAQMEIIDGRLRAIEARVPYKSKGFQDIDISPSRAKQDLNPILTKSSALAYSGNLFTLPADYIQILEVMHNSTTPVDVVDDSTINYILRSTITSPSVDNPVALMYGDKVEVFPSSIVADITVKFYDKPADPIWAYVSIGASNNPIHDSSNSVEFTLGPACHNEIVIKILEYVGVNLRDADIVAYSSKKDSPNEA
tara:strand:- start:146 stop:826 length:681 start_codon:yes stop_codon:yes gene_type:complete